MGVVKSFGSLLASTISNAVLLRCAVWLCVTALASFRVRCLHCSLTAMGRNILLLIAFAIGLSVGHVAWAQAPLTLTQGDFSIGIVPLTGEIPASAFYRYQNLSANTGFERPGHSLLFFYYDSVADALALGIVHGPPLVGVTNSTGIARFVINDLPASSTLELRDDPQDQFEFAPPIARLRWKWYSGRADGAIINHLGNDFSIKISPQFIQGTTNWDVLTLGPEGIDIISLPALDQSVFVAMGAAAGQGARAVFSTHPKDLYTFVPITFDATRSIAPAGQDIVLYEWDFDGDRVFDAHTQRAVVSHVFQRNGAVPVSLRVSTADGRTATSTQTLTLQPQKGVSGRRSISTPTALPGSTFRVTLSFTIEQNLVGLGIEEVWPASWKIKAVQNDGAVLKAQRGQWVFPNALKAGQTKTIVYDVTVPSPDKLETLPQMFPVQGALTGSLPNFKTAITGESWVEIASCLSAPVALAHFNVAQNELDLRLPETISAAQLTYAQTLWLEEGNLPSACSSSFTLSALQRVNSHRALQLAVDEALPSGGILRGVRVWRSILTAFPQRQLFPSGAGGNRFRVQLDIRAIRDLDSVGITETLPFGWQVEPLEIADVVYHPRQQQWVLLKPLKMGQTKRIVYDVVVPAGERAQDFSLRGSAHIVDSLFSEIIEGDRDVTVLTCLPVPLAIAHWDVEKNAIDLSLDNVIQLQQAQAATDLWVKDQTLPGTCGAELTFELLRAVTQRAVTKIPLGQPLPE